MIAVWLVIVNCATVFSQNMSFFYSYRSDRELPESNLTAFIYIHDDMDEIEYVTTLDVLMRAKIDTVQVGEFSHVKNILTQVEVNLIPEISFKELKDESPEMPRCDLVVVPGGSAVAQIAQNELAVETIKKHLDMNKVVGLIGEAPRLLNVYNPGRGRRVTCADRIVPEIVQHHLYTNASTTIDGNLITSKSPATAMEFALTIVEKLLGRRTADLIAKDLLYNYTSIIS